MALYFYDTALLEKLRFWTKKTNLHIYGPDETRQLFETIADETDDSPIQLPILCLRRSGGYTILNINKKPLTYDGAFIERDDDVSTQIDAVPILINYQLDIYAKFLQEADAYARNLVFNIINYPTLKINVPYGESSYFSHYANIRIAQNIQDNSAIPERMVPGLFTRLSLSIDIDDAYLWDIRTRSNSVIIGDVELNVHNPLTNDVVDDFTVEKWHYTNK